MKTNPKVSVIIPSFNSMSFVDICLKSLVKTDYPNYEVIIVDDGSTDGSYELLLKRCKNNKKIKVLRNSKNMKLAYTKNRGIKASTGDIIVILEIDTEVDKNWIKEGVKPFLVDDSVVGVQAKILDIKLKNLIQAMNLYLMPQTGWMVSKEVYTKNTKNNAKGDECLGGALGIFYKRSLFKEIGYFDEKLQFNIDDHDFNWRVWLSGHRIVSQPTSMIYHWTVKNDWRLRGGGMKKADWEFQFAKMPRIFIKNYDLLHLIRYLPEMILIMYFRALVNLMRGNFNTIKGVFRATIWNVQNLDDSLRERKKIQTQVRRVNDEYVINKIMIKKSIFSFFFGYWIPTMSRVLSTLKENEKKFI